MTSQNGLSDVSSLLPVFLWMRGCTREKAHAARMLDRLIRGPITS